MGFGVLDDNWKVDDKKLYLPSKGKPKFSHDNIVSSNSGRTEAGNMHIRWVKRDILNIALTWEKLTGDEKDRIVKLLQGRTFTFTYWDNGKKTMPAYCGKVEYELDSMELYADEGGLYRNIAATVVQMG